MKKLASILLFFVPAIMFAQHSVQLIPDVPSTVKVSIPGYNERIPAAIVNMTMQFDAATEILSVQMNSGGVASPNYGYVWLPQHEIVYDEMRSYMKNRGFRLKKEQTFIDQENFLNLQSQPVLASVFADGMTFDGNYDLQVPPKKKIRKELERQMIPLDGVRTLELKFKVNPNTKDVVLTLRNPMPMTSRKRIAFMAEDVIINISIDRCKLTEEQLTTVKEYLNMFKAGEDMLAELKRNNRSLMGRVAGLLIDQYEAIDTKRFQNTGCEEIGTTFEELEECVERIRQSMSKPAPDPTPTSKSNDCDTKKLNAEIKSTTTKLNNLVNDWSLASDASSKAEKKAAFDAAVKAFDAKLNGLPSGCKSKLDAKLLKNYEFVKKLIK